MKEGCIEVHQKPTLKLPMAAKRPMTAKLPMPKRPMPKRPMVERPMPTLPMVVRPLAQGLEKVGSVVRPLVRIPVEIAEHNPKSTDYDIRRFFVFQEVMIRLTISADTLRRPHTLLPHHEYIESLQTD